MSNDDKCPCVDGLPDPCTLCGAPADGVCEIDTHPAEVDQITAVDEGGYAHEQCAT